VLLRLGRAVPARRPALGTAPAAGDIRGRTTAVTAATTEPTALVLPRAAATTAADAEPVPEQGRVASKGLVGGLVGLGVPPAKAGVVAVVEPMPGLQRGAQAVGDRHGPRGARAVDLGLKLLAGPGLERLTGLADRLGQAVQVACDLLPILRGHAAAVL